MLKGKLSGKQNGFRGGKLNIGVINEVFDIFSTAQQKNNYSRPVVILAILGVNKAFNSIRGADVLNGN